jgi:hypothetical protein
MLLGFFLLLALAGPAGPASNDEALVMKSWKAFQAAVGAGDRPAVAGMTYFPFRHPALDVAGNAPLSRAQFLAKFDRIFTPGIRKQAAQGTPVRVTPADLREAKQDGADPCGQLGDWVVQLPPEEKIDFNRDDEAFLRLVFRVVQGKAVLHRVIGCQ